MCGNGKLPKMMGKPARTLLFGDFPGPCFMTCTKPLALSSYNPATLPTFYTYFFPWHLFELAKCCEMENVGNLTAKASQCILQGRMRAPHTLCSAVHASSPKPHPRLPVPVEPILAVLTRSVSQWAFLFWCK